MYFLEIKYCYIRNVAYINLEAIYQNCFRYTVFGLGATSEIA